MREFTGISKIIVALALFEYLTASQLTRGGFAPSSIRYVRKQLKALVAQGLVLPLGGRSVNLPLVYTLAVIAATDDLAERLKRWTEEVLGALDQPEQGERFFFCSCDLATVSPEELFLSPVWKQACSSGKTPLLVLE